MDLQGSTSMAPSLLAAQQSPAAPGSRRLAVACEARIPAACQAMSNEQSLLGRLLYKNARPHRRHAHHAKAAAVFKSVDSLLDTCNLAELKELAVVACRGGANSCQVGDTAHLEVMLKDIFGEASKLCNLTQAACLTLSPLVVQGFFAPFALGTCAVLGRLFKLASEIKEAAGAAKGTLSAEVRHSKTNLSQASDGDVIFVSSAAEKTSQTSDQVSPGLEDLGDPVHNLPIEQQLAPKSKKLKYSQKVRSTDEKLETELTSELRPPVALLSEVKEEGSLDDLGEVVGEAELAEIISAPLARGEMSEIQKEVQESSIHHPGESVCSGDSLSGTRLQKQVQKSAPCLLRPLTLESVFL